MSFMLLDMGRVASPSGCSARLVTGVTSRVWDISSRGKCRILVANMPESVAEPVVVTPAEPQNQTEVFAVHGADPEVLAYAMAKYSRSALSMKESLKEISSQRAEQFLN